MEGFAFSLGMSPDAVVGMREEVEGGGGGVGGSLFVDKQEDQQLHHVMIRESLDHGPKGSLGCGCGCGCRCGYARETRESTVHGNY